MPFTSVAIFGATGNIGPAIVAAALKDKSLKVTIVTRTESLAAKKDLLDGFTKQGAIIKSVDSFDSVDQVAAALAGVDVVVSAVAGAGLQSQTVLISAAKKAGVKRFYPSEYGIDDKSSPSITHPLIDAKKAIRKAVVDAGLELVVAFTGFFSEWAFAPFYTFDFEKSTVEIVGDGNAKIGFTAIEHIGEVIIQSINHPKTQGKEVYFAAQLNIASYNEIIAIKEAAIGKKFTKTYVSIEEAEKKAAANPNPWDTLGTWLRIWQAKGFAVSPNNLAADFKVTPKTLKDLFA